MAPSVVLTGGCVVADVRCFRSRNQTVFQRIFFFNFKSKLKNIEITGEKKYQKEMLLAPWNKPLQNSHDSDNLTQNSNFID